jgi:3-hydroxyacyl-[acyl-carrier-protein] dehydratase
LSLSKRKRSVRDEMNRVRREIIASAVAPARFVEPDRITRAYVFDATFIGFSGHFPGYPILPAFVQILTAATLAEERIGEPVTLSSLKKAKFMQEIRPGREIVVECRERLFEGAFRWEASITLGDKLASKFIMILTLKRES